MTVAKTMRLVVFVEQGPIAIHCHGSAIFSIEPKLCTVKVQPKFVGVEVTGLSSDAIVTATIPNPVFKISESPAIAVDPRRSGHDANDGKDSSTDRKTHVVVPTLG